MTLFWVGGRGDWATATEWLPQHIPTTSDDVLISNAETDVAIGSSTAAAANSVQLIYSATLDVAGSLTVGGALNLSDGVYLRLMGGVVTAGSITGPNGQDGWVTGYGGLHVGVMKGAYFTADGGRMILNFDASPGYASAGVNAGAVLEVVNGFLYGGISFKGLGAGLQIDAPQSFTTAVSHLLVTDVIDLRGVVAESVTYDGRLHVGVGGGQSLSLQVSGSVGGDVVSYADDGAGGTNVFWTPPPQSWTGGSGDWAAATGWGTGHAPTASDVAVVNNAGSGAADSGPVIGASTDAVAGTLYLNDATLTVRGSLTATSSIVTSSSTIRLLGGVITAPSISDAFISGYGAIQADLPGMSTVHATGGTLVVSDRLYGWLFADAQSRLEVTGASPGYAVLNGAGATLQLDSPETFTGYISGADSTDVLDLRGVVAAAVAYKGSVLTVSDAGGRSLSFNVGGDRPFGGGGVAGFNVTATPDGAGGTNVTWSPTVSTVGAGAITSVSTAQTYTGKTLIYGDLALAAGGSVASSQQVALKASGAVFDVSGAAAGGATVTIQELSGVAGSVIGLGSGVLSLTETVAATYSGAIADGGVAGGTGGGLVINGTAALTLAGDDTYTGKTQIYGQLNLTGSAVLNHSKAVVLKSAAAVFDISGATGKEAILNFAGVAGSQVHLGVNTLKINESTAATYSGVISDGGVAGGTGGGLIVKGTAPLTLAGANTFTGGVQLLGGTLELASPTAAGVGHALTFTGPATLQLDAGALTGSGAARSFGTAITGFAAGDHIDLASLTYGQGATAIYSGSTLTVTSGGSSVALNVTGLAAGASFSATDDGHGHVLVGLVGG